MEQITDARQMRGLEIAQNSRIEQIDLNLYKVPAQGGSGTYTVNFGEHEPTCDCPDCQTRGIKCKHQWAVEYFIKLEKGEFENMTTTKVIKITYPQNWPAYNRAQTSEIRMFDNLLKDLVQGIEEPLNEGRGRPSLSLRETLFCVIQKVYSQLSQRRAHTLYKNAQEKQQIGHAPHFNAIGKLLNREDITPILHDLLTLSALPLRSVETHFAIDSSGFRTTQFNEYCRYKHHTRSEHKWVKAHILIGTKTNVVVGAKMTADNTGDSKELTALVKKANENGFRIDELSADKAYASKENYKAIDDLGGVPYIPFRSNMTGKSYSGSTLWKKMYHYFKFNQEEFMQHYHRRSNVETVFHMVKMKFGDKLKSKNRIAQENELLCKFIAHNICVLIQEMYELGL